MVDDPLLDHARRLWADLAGAPVAVRPGAAAVVVSPESSLCPPGWVGLVTLGDAAIVTVPDDECARTVRRAVHGHPVTALTDVVAGLPVVAALGPATLAYCDAVGFDPGPVEAVPADDPALGAFLTSASDDDAGEAGLDHIESPAFVVRAGVAVVAAAGFSRWPRDTAHIHVMTAAAHRGRGLARTVAAAAVADALAAGMVAQWRARLEASRRVARALGFRQVGTQFSVRLT